MTERLYYIGDSGPFYYDDSGTAGAEGGTLSGENLQALLAEGSIKIGVSGVDAGHAMRRDDIESGIAAGAAASVSDTAYGAGWNGVTTVAPSKNAIYDKIETMGSASPFIYAADYGVDSGESAANNVTYLQAAIDAADAAGGQTVVLPAGTIQIASSIEMGGKDNVKIVGCGVNATNLQTTSATAHVFHWTATARWQEFSDFTISCSTTKSAGAYFYAASAVYRTMWQRLKLRDWYDGIKLDAFEECRIINCQIAEPDAAGVAIIAGKAAGAAQGANLYIINCFLRGTDGTDGVGGTPVGQHGIVIYDADAVFASNTDIGGFIGNDLAFSPTTRANNHHFVQCFFDATKDGDCILFAGAGVKTQIMFTGCWIASAGQEAGGAATVRGISIQSGFGAVQFNFIGGRIYNCKGNGIDVRADSPSIHFVGTIFESNGQGASAGHRWGAYIATGLNNTSVSLKSCKFVGASDDGSVYYGSNCRQYFLTDCDCDDDISDNGTGYMVANNTENGGTPYPTHFGAWQTIVNGTSYSATTSFSGTADADMIITGYVACTTAGDVAIIDAQTPTNTVRTLGYALANSGITYAGVSCPVKSGDTWTLRFQHGGGTWEAYGWYVPVGNN